MISNEVKPLQDIKACLILTVMNFIYLIVGLDLTWLANLRCRNIYFALFLGLQYDDFLP